MPTTPVSPERRIVLSDVNRRDLQLPRKFSDEVLDYEIDWNAITSGDPITGEVEAAVAGGVSIDANSTVDGITRLRLSGGSRIYAVATIDLLAITEDGERIGCRLKLPVTFRESAPGPIARLLSGSLAGSGSFAGDLALSSGEEIQLLGQVSAEALIVGALRVTVIRTLAGELLASSGLSGSLTVGEASVVSLVGQVSADGSMAGTLTATPQVKLSGALAALAALTGAMSVESAPAEVTVLATRLFGPGHGQTSSAPVSTGATTTTALTLVNESGAAMDRVRLGFIGWAIQAVPNNPGAPLGIPGNAIPIDSATIEYPVGTVVGTFQRSGSGAFSIPSDSDLITTDELALASAIPAGASFRVSVASTVPNGQRRLHNNGLAAVLTTAMSDTLKPARVFATGDSIMTQDSRGAVLLAGQGRCPVLQMSIGGTRGFDYVPVAARLAKLAKDVGCTDSITNFGTNDFGAGQSEAQLATTLAALRAAYESEGLDHWQATILPQSSMPTLSVVSATVDSAAEPTLTITVSETDVARFEDAMIYNIAGDTGTPSLNGNYWFTKASPTTWTAPIAADRAGRIGSGPITVKPPFNYSSTSWQQPSGTAWHSQPTLSTSPRANINARIRAGEFGGLVEWADAVEAGRNSGQWKTRQDQPDAYQLDNVTLAVTSGILNANRFSFTPSQSNNRSQGGGVAMLSGAQRGQYRSSTGSATNNVSLSSNLPAAPAPGDQFVMMSGAASPTSDGVHPALSGGGTGGAQNRLVDVNRAWLDTLLT